MTTNCFDVVSLFDLKKQAKPTATNAKTNRLKGPAVGVSMNVSVCLCVCATSGKWFCYGQRLKSLQLCLARKNI